jgi:gas vesicle protein
MEKTELNGNSCSALPFFVTGLGAGIVVAVLFAPQSGATARRLIARRVEEGKHWLQGKATAAQDYVKEQREELRDRVKEVAEVIGGN